ncbi:MAG: hypothetical protein HS108_03225 [Planctomycetes bacterium]|nr:hypothetical protein [Planctomycetota bacterium]MCL4728913.1 hypothetical protein [Planctomycetota bacterium]
MSIIYYVDYPCPVKESVKPGRMLRLLYGRERANEAVNKARRDNPAASPEQVMVNLSLADGAGTKELRRVSAAEVHRQVAELDALADHCRDCKARIERQNFGCRSRVDFPLTFKAEAFLMGLIHARDGDPTPTLLCNYLESNGIVGNEPAEMRKLPGVWFESDKPLVRRFADGRRVSANQLFELLFLTGQISPKHARFLLGLLGLYAGNLPLDRALYSLPNLFVVEREEAGMVVSRAGLNLSENSQDDRSTKQIQNFFGALLLGAELGCDVWVKR